MSSKLQGNWKNMLKRRQTVERQKQYATEKQVSFAGWVQKIQGYKTEDLRSKNPFIRWYGYVQNEDPGQIR